MQHDEEIEKGKKKEKSITLIASSMTEKHEEPKVESSRTISSKGVQESRTQVLKGKRQLKRMINLQLKMTLKTKMSIWHFCPRDFQISNSKEAKHSPNHFEKILNRTQALLIKPSLNATTVEQLVTFQINVESLKLRRKKRALKLWTIKKIL